MGFCKGLPTLLIPPPALMRLARLWAFVMVFGVRRASISSFPHDAFDKFVHTKH